MNKPSLFHPDSVPNLLHLRFLTELNQLESVTATEKLLYELEQIKKNTFDSQQNLAEVQHELRDEKARRREEEKKGCVRKHRVDTGIIMPIFLRGVGG